MEAVLCRAGWWRQGSVGSPVDKEEGRVGSPTAPELEVRREVEIGSEARQLPTLVVYRR
jgi:hypothetical protein